MDVQDSQDGRIVILSKQLDSRAKVLDLCNSLLFSGSTAGFIHLRMSGYGYPSLTSDIVLSLIVFAMALAAYRFGNKASLSEKLFISQSSLTIHKQGLFTSVKRTFDVSKISDFRYLAKPRSTKHPLSGKTFDYLGFQTEQQVIDDMHGDNRIAFDYEGKSLSFGQDVPSWLFEELELLLYDITQNDLRYNDEFEKTFKEGKADTPDV